MTIATTCLACSLSEFDEICMRNEGITVRITVNKHIFRIFDEYFTICSAILVDTFP